MLQNHSVIYARVWDTAKNCGNHFSNQSNPKTFGTTLPRHQNQGGQNSRYPPPNVTYAQATGGSAPLRSCRYWKVEGHLIQECPTRFARYGPYVSNQRSDHALPVTGGPRTNWTYMLTGTEERKDQRN